jgi:hypothetical protein
VCLSRAPRQIRTVLELVVVLMSLQKLWGELIEIINSGWCGCHGLTAVMVMEGATANTAA